MIAICPKHGVTDEYEERELLEFSNDPNDDNRKPRHEGTMTVCGDGCEEQVDWVPTWAVNAARKIEYDPTPENVGETAKKLLDIFGPLVEAAREASLYRCSCHEGFRDRKLTDPDCISCEIGGDALRAALAALEGKP